MAGRDSVHLTGGLLAFSRHSSIASPCSKLEISDFASDYDCFQHQEQLDANVPRGHHSASSLAGVACPGLRLLALPPRPPPPPPDCAPRPPRFRPPFFSFGGGRTNAKSTDKVWSSSFVPFAPSMALRASLSVGYSIRT